MPQLSLSVAYNFVRTTQTNHHAKGEYAVLLVSTVKSASTTPFGFKVKTLTRRVSFSIGQTIGLSDFSICHTALTAGLECSYLRVKYAQRWSSCDPSLYSEHTTHKFERLEESKRWLHRYLNESMTSSPSEELSRNSIPMSQYVVVFEG